MRTQLQNPASQAQAILGAWKNGDVKLFHEELNHVAGSGSETAESEESERMELLCAIAEDLRNPSTQPLADDPGNIYATLLRHLALSRRPGQQIAKAREGSIETKPVVTLQ